MRAGGAAEGGGAGGRRAGPARGSPGSLPGMLRAGLEALAGAAVRTLSRASAPRPARLRVPGLSAGTTVRFDDHGVPHVRAASEADAVRALGVCHALDRFFQMDMTRRVLSGRLAETVGEKDLGGNGLPPLSKGTTLDVDRLFRVLDLRRAARAALDAATPDERALLEAYVDGANAVVRRLSWATSLDHRLLRLPLTPWTAEDACLLAKGMALGLSFKWRSGPVFAAIADALRERTDALAAILPRSPGRRDPGIARYVAETRGLAGALSAVGWEAPLAGSNSFVVGAGRSASGAPILANDPHLALSLPSVWYLASVSGGPYAAVGATMAGVPGVVIGRTPTVAWGLTNVQLDDADLFREEVDGTGTRYRVDGVWRDLRVETQELRRRGRGPVMFRLRRTHRGPLLSDAFAGAEGRPLSLRLMLHETLRDMPTFLRLGRARTAEDVERAAEGYGSPAQNLVFATTEGEAGYRFLGRVPLRPPGPHPALPRDGTVSSSDWVGEVPVDELPRFRIRRDGDVVTANQPTVGPEFPYYLSHLYEPGYRAARIRELLAGRTGLTPRDLAAIQLDAKSLAAEAFRQAVLLPCADAIRASRPPAVPLLDRLLAASGEEGVDTVGPALLHLTYFRLAEKVFAPALGEDLVHRWMACVNLMDAPLLEAFTDPAGVWVKPAVRATKLGEALEEAARDLAALGLPTDARWGDVHTLTIRHALSAAPLVGPAYTLGPFRVPGGPYTVSAGQYLHDRPCAMAVGASYRQVVDLADPEGSGRMITFAGQSGHVGSKHYADLQALWLRGETLPMRLSTWPERGRDLRLEPA